MPAKNIQTKQNALVGIIPHFRQERNPYEGEREIMDNTNTRTPPIMKGIEKTAHDAGLAVYFVRTLVKEGRIPYIKAGKKFLINWDTFLTFLEKGDDRHE